MHRLKNYNKLIKSLGKNVDFKIYKSGRKNTYKILHVKSDNLLVIHPGENAIKPIKKWLKQFNLIL